MRNIWIVAQKEFKHFVVSPIAYVVAFAILIFIGIYFYANLSYAAQQQIAPSVQIILSPLVTLLLFFSSAITMRTLAEEQKNGTLEILLTAPVRDWEVVVGKWLGSLLFILGLLLLTWLFPIMLNQLVRPGIDQGLMTTGYLGLILLSSALLAIGVMASSFFGNQIAAFFASLGIVLVLLVISFPAQAAGPTGSELLRYLNIGDHFYDNFYRGVIELKDVVYYVSVTALALFIGSVSVETRRWR
jgi:ABC-2 type transport system permease protein